MASVLSYGLANGPPDAALVAAANDDQLRTPEAIRAQVRRLAGDLATSQVMPFLAEHLRYPEARTTFKDADHRAATAKSLLAQGGYTSQQVSRLINNFGDTVSPTDAWVKGLLGGKDFLGRLLQSEVGKTAEPRAGLLTQRAFLIALSEVDGNDPIRRGKFITERLLCNALPPIPLGVVNAIPEDKTQTLRERLAVHSKDPACAGCHQLLEGIGLGLEGFDDFGLVRTTEAGKPADARATLLGTSDKEWQLPHLRGRDTAPGRRDDGVHGRLCEAQQNAVLLWLPPLHEQGQGRGRLAGLVRQSFRRPGLPPQHGDDVRRLDRAHRLSQRAEPRGLHGGPQHVQVAQRGGPLRRRGSTVGSIARPSGLAMPCHRVRLARPVRFGERG
jgi:hypothetical protein